MNITNEDCMKLMARSRNHQYDLAIVDPPYFSGPEKRRYYGAEKSANGVKRRDYEIEPQNWRVPGPEYFEELKRVSRHQIVWGCNYYDTYLGPGRIIWDKINDGTSYSDAEIAYCSLHDSVRIFRFMWNGMMQGASIKEGWIQQGNKKLNQKRIHTTEKPVALYHWLLLKYAQPGCKILDTHIGSGSIAIACIDLQYELTACDISKQVYQKCMARIQQHNSKEQNLPHRLFTLPKPTLEPTLF